MVRSDVYMYVDPRPWSQIESERHRRIDLLYRLYALVPSCQVAAVGVMKMMKRSTGLVMPCRRAPPLPGIVDDRRKLAHTLVPEAWRIAEVRAVKYVLSAAMIKSCLRGYVIVPSRRRQGLKRLDGYMHMCMYMFVHVCNRDRADPSPSRRAPRLR